ncbi:MAG TPA: O-antigen ligase family protein [Anaerolineaceae bacterium]
MKKIGSFCDGILEAAWLAAVIGVPLFFNKYVNNAFEPEKVYLLRSLALVMLAAWLVKIIAQGGLHWEGLKLARNGWGSLIKQPLFIPLAGFVVVFIVTSVLSIAPGASFWGAFIRGMGTYTYLSYIAIFVVMVANLRSMKQVERLITAAILTSIPVSLYGIGQRFGIEPIVVTSRETESFRVGSTLGHPVFLAAYQILIFPLTLSRILQRTVAWWQDKSRRMFNGWMAIAYATILLLQVLALFYTASRGPFLGLMGGLFVMFLIVAIYWRKRWIVIATIGVATALLGFLVILRIPGGPLSSLMKDPSVNRFSQILDPKAGTGMFRSLSWRMAYEAVTSRVPLQMGAGQVDSLQSLRFWLGYGPETIKIVARQYFLPEIIIANGGTYLIPDRIHNEIWDSLLSQGVVGLSVYASMIGFLYYFGLYWLGVVRSRREKILFWACFLLGGALGGAGLSFWQGMGFFGLGYRFGTTIGVIVYLVYFSWFSHFDPAVHGVPLPRALAMMALLTSLIAHSGEIGFSFPIGTSVLLFWMSAAMLYTVGYVLPRRENWVPGNAPASCGALEPKDAGQHTPGGVRPGIAQAATGRHKRSQRSAQRSGAIGRLLDWCFAHRMEVTGGLLSSIVLANLGFELIQKGNSTSPITIIINALTRLPGSKNAFNPIILFVLVFIWLSFAILWVLENRPIPEHKPAKRSSGSLISSIGITAGVSAGMGLLFWLAIASQLAAMILLTPANPKPDINLLGAYNTMQVTYYLYYAVVFTLIAIVLTESRNAYDSVETSRARLALISAPVIVIFGLVAFYLLNFSWTLADVAASRAEPFKDSEQWSIVTSLYQQSIKHAPLGDSYYQSLGKSIAKQAGQAKDPQERATLYGQAEQKLNEGQRIYPLNTGFITSKAELYLNWATIETDGTKRTLYAKKAEEFIRSAMILEPQNFELWDSLGYIDLAIYNQPDEGLQKLQRSLAIFPNNHKAYALSGDAYSIKARLKTGDERTNLFNQALEKYLKAIEIHTSTYTYFSAAGKTYIELREYTKAIEVYQKALEKAPDSEKYKMDEMLARLYADTNQKATALVHIQRAIDKAPKERQADLQDLKNKIISLP